MNKFVLPSILLGLGIACYAGGTITMYAEMTQEYDHSTLDLVVNENGEIRNMELFSFVAGKSEGANFNGLTLYNVDSIEKLNTTPANGMELPEEEAESEKKSFVRFACKKTENCDLNVDVFAVMEEQDQIESLQLYALDEGNWVKLKDVPAGKECDVYAFFDIPVTSKNLQLRILNEDSLSLVNVYEENKDEPETV